MTDSVLIVDHSLPFSRKLAKALEKITTRKIHKTFSFEETKKFLEQDSERIFLAVSNADLPDCEHGEIVDLLCGEGIPVIVMTPEIDDLVRERMLSKSIVEYFLKSSNTANDIANIISTFKRLSSNHVNKLLVVDDSNVMRQLLINLLKRRNYTLIEASDGVDALNQLEKHPDVKLVITDYNMPNMDGFQLITKLRTSFGKDRLAIIALSANTDPSLSARLLKTGANDFLDKNFTPEEFFARITQNLEMLHLIEQTKDAANRDYLTKLYNRRFFFHAVPDLVQTKTQAVLGLAMMDLDHFKKINDTYGHDAGDQALRVIAQLLQEFFPSPTLVARFGGEEFCLLLESDSLDSVEARLNAFREQVSKVEIKEGQHRFKMTLSVGVTLLGEGEHVEKAITRADAGLYESKRKGRNQVTRKLA